ncbi:hypothetical protein BGW36DRAFT_353459 [Talaromyces proteolyticus]|uniref:Uncharacterized protein n=1 Tax=Talaromyces proteolyticus TaxID=1131652 RepID=A0AAD4L4S3_9EURO|nr:uncharacterized protein BGW36DRAFT_353459 [Talaromyces proteolyticus]KAH8705031.1 hypothetical protein BGW36DRAFT_353459 [Talaromyces proteolyticus]
MSSTIIWPQQYLPGTPDNYVSNEVYAAGITAEQVRPYLVDITKWESYYNNVAQIIPPTSGSILTKKDKFSLFDLWIPSVAGASVGIDRPYSYLTRTANLACVAGWG